MALSAGFSSVSGVSDFFFGYIFSPVKNSTRNKLPDYSTTTEINLPTTVENLMEQEKDRGYDVESPTVRRSLASRIFIGIMFSLCALTGIAGNSLVLIVILKDPGLQINNHLSNLTIFNLAITDLFTSFFVALPGAINVIYDGSPWPYFICAWCTMMNIGMIGATYNMLLVVTMDRYIAVKYPLHYPQMVTFNKLMGVLVVVWIVGLSVGIDFAFVQNGWFKFDYWAGICDAKYGDHPTERGKMMIHVLTASVFEFFFTTIAIIWGNIRIVIMSKDKGRGKTAEDKAEASVNKKILKSMVIVIVLYVIFNTPAAFVRIYKVSSPQGDLFPNWATSLFQVFQFLASVCNPMIYGLFRKDFQVAFGKVLKNTLAIIKSKF